MMLEKHQSFVSSSFRISGNAASDKNIKDGVCAQIEKNFAKAKWKVLLLMHLILEYSCLTFGHLSIFSPGGTLKFILIANHNFVWPEQSNNIVRDRVIGLIITTNK